MSLRCRLGYHAWEYGIRHGTKCNVFGNLEINLRVCLRCKLREELWVTERTRFAEWMRVNPTEQQAKP